MAIKTISQPVVRTPGNPFRRIGAAILRVDAWLAPARHEHQDERLVGMNASSELWMPLFMVPGAVKLTHPDVVLQEGVRK